MSNMNTNTNMSTNTMTSTNPFDEIGHIDAIVKQFKILTDNTMKLIRNTNKNKSKPL